MPVALIEDQHQFILHHKILWEGEDVDVAAPMVSEAQALYPELRACSFDRGFHSPDNRIKLDALLDLNVLPIDALLDLNVLPKRGIFPEPTANGRRRNPSRPRGVRIRQSSRPSMGWNTGGSTVSAAMARTASRAPSRCRYWPPTCIASGCSCNQRERKRRFDCAA